MTPRRKRIVLGEGCYSDISRVGRPQDKKGAFLEFHMHGCKIARKMHPFEWGQRIRLVAEILPKGRGRGGKR